jgi:hypothetical protein
MVSLNGNVLILFKPKHELLERFRKHRYSVV